MSDMYLRKDIRNPTNKNMDYWARNLTNVEKNIIKQMRTNVKNELSKLDIYVPTVIQPIETTNSTAWGDYGWDEVAEDIPEGSNFIIFELLLIIKNDTIKPFKNGLYMQHNLQTTASKKAVDNVLKKYFGPYYTWNMTEKDAIKIQI
jgi:hypothetical protein